MKVHTTNYADTFIEIAGDCPATAGETPPAKENARSVANIQYDLLSRNPYQFTSDDILFKVYAERNNLDESEWAEARAQFFSKGQPCFRASPLTKRYGWGVHSDKDGRMAIYGCDTDAYRKLAEDKTLTLLKAMRAAR